ncbi:MAG: hypothetical protein Q4A01_09025, partial [Coriobacteriales bacterium]|nr:hypothetical protein [Coriobacteriales bacterium]
MARDMQGGQRGSSRNGSGSSRTRGRADASRGSRPSRGSGRQQSRRGTLTQPDTGYRLHSRRVSYPNGSGSPLSFLLRPRVLLLIAILVLVIVALVVGVSSCVRGNKERATQAAEQAKPVNEQDSRVAAGVSAATTSKFTEVLDQNELLEKIAQQANEYDDERLLDLSLREPTSRQFVADYPSSDKSSRPYTDTIKQGEVPRLFDWDSRWGAVTYGNGPLAITGSGPTTLAMAYMGLTGKTDFSPTEIAQQASKSNYTNDESGSKGELFAKLATSMGLKSEQHDPSAETILYSLGDNTVFAVELKPNTLTDEAHWALLVNINEDGMLTVFDPTSTEVSNKTWGLDTIAGASSNLYSITLSDEAIAALEKNASGTTSTGTGTSTGTTTDTDTDTGLSTNT